MAKNQRSAVREKWQNIKRPESKKNGKTSSDRSQKKWLNIKGLQAKEDGKKIKRPCTKKNGKNLSVWTLSFLNNKNQRSTIRKNSKKSNFCFQTKISKNQNLWSK